MFLRWYAHPRLWKFSALLMGAISLASCGNRASATPTPSSVSPTATTAATAPAVASVTPTPTSPPPGMDNVIPRPASEQATGGSFSLSADTGIYVEPATDELKAIGQYLADHLNPATGYALKVQGANEAPARGNITLSLTGADPALGAEPASPATTAGGSSRSHSLRARAASACSRSSAESAATPRARRIACLASADVVW